MNREQMYDMAMRTHNLGPLQMDYLRKVTHEIPMSMEEMFDCARETKTMSASDLRRALGAYRD